MRTVKPSFVFKILCVLTLFTQTLENLSFREDDDINLAGTLAQYEGTMSSSWI